MTWGGQLYGNGVTLPLVFPRGRIYHGVWGTALFQSMYQQPLGLWRSLPLMPEWYMGVGSLLLIAIPSILWPPLLVVVTTLLAASIGIPLLQALVTAKHATLHHLKLRDRWRCRAAIAAMHIVQPITRLLGRLGCGLTPWRRGKFRYTGMPRLRHHQFWSERWHATTDLLAKLETTLVRMGARTARGGDFDPWDIQVCGGMVGHVRVLLTVEEHGGGRLMIRLRSWPKVQPPVVALMGLFVGLALLAMVMGNAPAAFAMSIVPVALGIRCVVDCASATAAYLEAIDPMKELES